jgi:hypothetical protein
VNACEVPAASAATSGETAIAIRSAVETVRTVVPLFFASVAVIVVLPTATVVASPRLPSAFDTVATAGFDVFHVTSFVTSCVELSV